ncbi:28 kDa ribonucleoprotein [Thalictrum thalictroides]|uniref:28 kDa ribonucleoprotein n=1 Tax=Thalictrum thalictroides TaxID=46969 RepID=A0A7J6X784_THATH|nr:28 kDa ribonucleoprotein [Thalictrum thalictroides]
MAVRLLWFPSIFSTEQNQQLLSLHKPLKTSFSSSLSLCCSSSTSTIPHFSSVSITRRKTNLLIFQVFNSATKQQTTETSSAETEQEPKTRLIAQNIPWSATVEDIQNLFKKYGNVLDVEMSMYSKTKNRGIAFIIMGSEEEAAEALAKLESYELEGRPISVAYAKSKKRKPLVARDTLPKFDVFIANLSWKVKGKDLLEFFAPMSGDLVAAQVTYKMNPTRKPTGYGFVSFSTKEKAEEAISSFQGKELMGKPGMKRYRKPMKLTLNCISFTRAIGLWVLPLLMNLKDLNYIMETTAAYRLSRF